IIIALIGLIICIYAWYVDRQLSKNKSYKAACDINDTVSCTKTFKSPWGKMFGFSNTILGILFYAGILALSYFGYTYLVFAGTIIAMAFSLYLAYILYFKIKTICLICTSIYIINILLLIVSYKNLY
ncbi:MAG: vitamin K epoxide reductase family protein, partial [Candidatus Babeliales bacterium]